MWKDIANLRLKRLNNHTKLQLHAWMTINSKKKMSQLENCLQSDHKLFSNVCIWLVFGRPDILWSVNKLARAITDWTKSCDERLARLISYIHHTCEYRQSCCVGNTAQQCRLGLFQDSDFAGDLEDSQSTSGGVLCIFGSHTFVPISWLCKKQTSVSHSSTEAETISLDGGLRMDGIPTLTLWDLVIEIFHSAPSKIQQPKEELRGDPSAVVKPNMHNLIQLKHTNVIPTNIDHIPSNTTHSGPSAMLYVFEHNEAVMKMIIKGRSPTMRHVSRTHRVALDWLFDKTNWDPKIQIRYIDTKHQLADILTKRNFTRDEWNNLLQLFNISHFSSLRCTKNFSLICGCSTMAKRIQEQKEERKVASKSRPAALNLSSSIATSSSSASSLNTSKSPGMPLASGKTLSRMSIEPRSFGAASTAQVRLKDAYLGGLMEKQRRNPSHQEEGNSEDSDNLRLEPGTTTKENLLPKTVKLG